MRVQNGLQINVTFWLFSESFEVPMEDLKTDCTKTSDELRRGRPYIHMNDPGRSEAWFFFTTPERFRIKEARLSLNHRRTRTNGFITILVNDDPLVTKYSNVTYADFEREVFDIPPNLLDCDENKISILLHSSSLGPYYISDARVEVEYSSYGDIYRFL